MKALREEGIDTVLINPSIATWQTPHELAHEVDFLPIHPGLCRLCLGKGTSRWRLACILWSKRSERWYRIGRMDVLERLGVQVPGTPIKTLEVSEDRDLLVQALKGRIKW